MKKNKYMPGAFVAGAFVMLPLRIPVLRGPVYATIRVGGPLAFGVPLPPQKCQILHLLSDFDEI